jgi:hypothetical protein
MWLGTGSESHSILDFGFWILELSLRLLAQAGAPKERQVEGLKPFWFLVKSQKSKY